MSVINILLKLKNPAGTIINPRKEDGHGSAVSTPSHVSVATLPLPAGASTEATQLLVKAKTDNLDIGLTALRDALKGGKTLADIWTSLQLQKELSESIWTDNTLGYFVRRVVIDEIAGTFVVSWTDADGNASAGPGTGKRPLSSPDREVVQSLFTATAGGTGYVSGDILARCLIIDTSVVPPVVLATLWFNVTNGLAISAPTGGTYRQDLGLTLQELQSALVAVIGNVAHDVADAGAPVKIGGKVTAMATPTAKLAAGVRSDAWFDEYGRLVTTDFDIELGQNIGSTALRDRFFAQRYTVLADSVADGLASFWTQTVANGGTVTVSGGEGLLQTSAAAAGAARLVGGLINYFPGQQAWFNSAIRLRDPTLTGNTQRVGLCTVDGSGNPQDGFLYELIDNVLNATVYKGGAVFSRVPSTSWSRFALAPYTPTSNYQQYEIRYTANSVWFYIGNVLRHVVSGTTVPITTTLDFRKLVQNFNTGNASNLTLGVRNIGAGRFGDPAKFQAPNGAQSVANVGVGTYGGVAGVSGTVNVPTGYWVSQFSGKSGTVPATMTVPGITGTIQLDGSNQSSTEFSDSPAPGTMVGPCTFTFSSTSSYVVAWQVIIP